MENCKKYTNILFIYNLDRKKGGRKFRFNIIIDISILIFNLPITISRLFYSPRKFYRKTTRAYIHTHTHAHTCPYIFHSLFKNSAPFEAVLSVRKRVSFEYNSTRYVSHMKKQLFFRPYSGSNKRGRLSRRLLN